MSIRWANDALREEVPTLSNSVLLAQAAGQRCAWSPAAILQGTRLPVGSPVPASASGVFAAPRSKKRLDQMKISTQQVHNSTTYQEMARIAANDGDQSGSHPAWDPV
jgi:hypothetical protein